MMLSVVAGIDVAVETEGKRHVPNQALKHGEADQAVAEEEDEIEITGGEFEDGACFAPSLPQQRKPLELNKHL